MKLLLTGALVATLLVAAPSGAQAPAVVADETVTLDGVKVKLRSKTRQVVTVNKTDGWHARVTFWARDDGVWVERFQATDGAIGYNGLVRPRKRVQGSVNGSGATAGCASAPRWFMRKLMFRLDQDRRPLIAIGS